MMDADKENRIARELRRLARAYGEGEFNKGEYRRRRRELLTQCIQEADPQLETANGQEQVDTPPPAQYPSWVRAVVLPFLMGAAVVIILCLVGYFIYTML